MIFFKLQTDAIDMGHRATHGYLTLISIIGIAATVGYAATGAWRFAGVSLVATVCYATGAGLVAFGHLRRGVDVGIVLSSTLMLGMLLGVYLLAPSGVDEGQTLIATAFYLSATAGFFARRYYQVLLIAVLAALIVLLYFFILARPAELEIRDLIIATTAILMAVGSTLIFRQADALRNMRQELQRTNDNLTKAMHVKDRFLANMSHEIRTPLSGMIGTADLLARDEPRSNQREMIESLQKSGASLLRIVEDILNIAKLDAGEYEFENQVLTVSGLIADVVALYRVPARGKGISLETMVAPAVPETIVGDRERLKQILVNLVSNAVKYTDDGSVVIHADIERTSTWSLVVAVRDTGAGIAVEDQPRLFRLFEQLDSSYAKRHSGTGLGLALTKRLTESAGGTIHVESSPGVGTTFTVRLPLIMPLEVAQTPSARTEQLSGAAKDSLRRATTRMVRKPRVIIAEDEPINATILTRSLESMGAVIAHAVNGTEVIDQLTAFKPDLILMDAQMPEMSGVEATSYIRSQPSPQGEIPIIGLTAYSHEHDLQVLLDAGMNECHTKPVALSVLEETIHRHLPGLFQEQVG